MLAITTLVQMTSFAVETRMTITPTRTTTHQSLDAGVNNHYSNDRINGICNSKTNTMARAASMAFAITKATQLQ